MLDNDVDECLLGIIVPELDGVGKGGRSEACGRYVRALSALLGEGVRVAAAVRRAGRNEYDRLCDMRRGLAALRAEAVAASPREVHLMRAGRAAQASVVQRMGEVSTSWGKRMVEGVWSIGGYRRRASGGGKSTRIPCGLLRACGYVEWLTSS